MLTIETVKSAIALTQELDGRDIFVSPLSGTPVQLLCARSTAGTVASPDLEYNPNPELISEQSVGPEDIHGLELTAYSDDVAKAVSMHLNFAKNKVKPAIDQLVNSITPQFDQAAKSMTYDLELVQVDPPEPMIAPSFEEMIFAYQDIPYIPFTRNVPLGKDYSGVEITELCKTSDSSIDAAFALFAASKGDAFLETVVKNMQLVTGNIQSLIDNHKDGLAVSTIIYLLCNKIYDNPPEGVSLSLNDFNTRVDDLRKAACVRLYQGYIDYARNTKNGLLILNYTTSQVFVNGNVYRKWREDGGNDAAIFASTVSNQVALFTQDVNDKQSELVEQWMSRSKIMASTMSAKLFVKQKDIFRTALLTVAQENFDDFFGHFVPEGMSATTSMKEYQLFLELLDIYTDNLKISDFNNIWTISTKAVCDCLFYYTDARKILQGVDEAIKVNPKLEIREALLLSTIEYVVDYICAQLVVS